MGKAGRKRKAGPREPNGRPQRTTVERLNEMADQVRRKEQATVLMQPHRGGRVGSTTLVKDVERVVISDGNYGKVVETLVDNRRPAVFGTDKPYAESPLGRFCLRNHLASELYEAGRKFATTVEKWQASRGVPVDRNRTPGPPPTEPSTKKENEAAAARRRTLQSKMVEAERELLNDGIETLIAVRQLVVDEYELSHEQDAHLISGLWALAVHFKLLDKSASLDRRS